MAHIHLIVHVMHELVPKLALIVLMGRHVNKMLSFIDCESRHDGFITPIHRLQPECKTLCMMFFTWLDTPFHNLEMKNVCTYSSQCLVNGYNEPHVQNIWKGFDFTTYIKGIK